MPIAALLAGATLLIPNSFVVSAQLPIALLFVCIFPYLICERVIRLRFPERFAPIWAISLNSAALIFIWNLLRVAGWLERPAFIVAWSVWQVCCCGLGMRANAKCQPFTRIGTVHVACVALTAIFAFWLLRGEIFEQCFSGDGAESYYLATSLFDHVLPHWELEKSGKFGPVVVNPSLLNSYWTAALMLLIDSPETATRGMFLLCCPATFTFLVLALKVSDFGPTAVCCAHLILMISWYSFYVGYRPFLMADVANPGVVDWFFALLLLLSFIALLDGDLAGWGSGIILASLVLYAGPVFLVISTVSAFLAKVVDRRQLIRAGLRTTFVLACIAAAYAVVALECGLLRDWLRTIDGEYLADFSNPLRYATSGWAFCSLFLLGAGGLPALGLLTGWSDGGTRIERFVSLNCVSYLLIVLCSDYKNVHYIGPIIVLPLWCWLLQISRLTARQSAFHLLTAMSIIAVIILSWPLERSVHNAERTMGLTTQFLTDDEFEAGLWARSVQKQLNGEEYFGCEIRRHTLVIYSVVSATRNASKNVVFTTANPPKDFYVLSTDSDTSARLCVRRGSLDQIKNDLTAQERKRFPRFMANLIRQ